ALLAVAAVVAALAGIDEVRILLAAGVLAALVHRTARDDPPPAATPTRAAVMVAAVGPGAAATAGAAVTTTAGLWPVFAFFTKVGALLFGSGYVLLAFLRTGLVVERGWLTEGQLLDAIAIGQVTPGPVFTTATFIGYLLAGPAGAVVATLGIFLPAFLFVAASAPLLPRLRRSPRVGAVLDGVNVASLALMAAVTVPLARAAIVDGATLLLALASAAALLVWRVNATWLVVGGAVAGLALGARG
nr:chromate transporter [Gemmatimonadaceae bacterium]